MSANNKNDQRVLRSGCDKRRKRRPNGHAEVRHAQNELYCSQQDYPSIYNT